MINKRSVIVLCSFCTKSIKKFKSQLVPNRKYYCCKSCYTKDHTYYKNCLYCGKEFSWNKRNCYKRSFCSIDCGNLYSKEHPYNKGVKRTETQKKAISKSLKGRYKGDKSPNWRGGVSSECNIRVTSAEWKRLRKIVYERDKWTCQECGVHCTTKGKTKIQCHHKVPYSISKDDSLENLETLCKSCHPKVERRFYKNLEEQNEICRQSS